MAGMNPRVKASLILWAVTFVTAFGSGELLRFSHMSVWVRAAVVGLIAGLSAWIVIAIMARSAKKKSNQ